MLALGMQLVSDKASQAPVKTFTSLSMSTVGEVLRVEADTSVSSEVPSRGTWSLSRCVDINIYIGISLHLKPQIKSLTRRSAPARVLNLVAVTTLRFKGSTAPTATSGVSTIATSFGGAVRIAALPYRIGKLSGLGTRAA